MPAQDIINGRGGTWHGSYGMTCCPCHNDKTPSLKVWDIGDYAFVRCFAGCTEGDGWKEVRDALAREGYLKREGAHSWRGVLPPRRDPNSPGAHAFDKRRKLALEIWRDTLRADGTLVERYLKSRGITIPVPTSLRYCEDLLHWSSGERWPAMVAKVSSPTMGSKCLAVQRTWLSRDGRGKANLEKPKMALGGMDKGAVKLSSPGVVIGLAEGIETALSVQQLFEVPTWATLGITRFVGITLPVTVEQVRLYPDGQDNDLAYSKAELAHTYWTTRGKKVIIVDPPEDHSDWNDYLMDK